MSTTAPRPLQARCFGPFTLLAGEERLGPWTSRRAKSLLKLLVLRHGRPVPREVLMEAFWPDAWPAAARNNLHGAVHALRRFLRDVHGDVEHVLFEDGCYLLAPELGLTDDVSAFERLARAGLRTGDLAALEAAADLYAGPLFDDDPYEEWMQARRRELEGVRLDVLDVLRRERRARGDLQGWADAARRILAAEPWREDAHRELMDVYARQGRPHLAVRQFQDCAVALRTALDAVPGPATVALLQRVRGA
jgi:DNA-binding SARP family transcriptional activator